MNIKEILTEDELDHLLNVGSCLMKACAHVDLKGGRAATLLMSFTSGVCAMLEVEGRFGDHDADPQDFFQQFLIVYTARLTQQA